MMRWKSIKESILFLKLLSVLYIGAAVLPTKHYKQDHSDVSWDQVLATVYNPTKTHPNK